MSWFARPLGPSASAARRRILREADDWIARFGGTKVRGAGWDARLVGDHQSVACNVVRYINEVYPALWDELGRDLGLQSSKRPAMTLVLVTPEDLEAGGHRGDSILAETAVTGTIASAEARIVALAGPPSDPAALAWGLTKAISFFVVSSHLMRLVGGEQSLLELAYADYGAAMLYHTRGWHPWFKTLDLIHTRTQLEDANLLDLLQHRPDRHASDVVTDRINLACLFMIFLHDLDRWQDIGREWLLRSLRSTGLRQATQHLARGLEMAEAEIHTTFLRWLDEHIAKASTV